MESIENFNPELNESDGKVSIENIGKRKSVGMKSEFVSDIERLILGEKIPASERKTLKAQREYINEWVSGSIGFLDFIQENNIISVTVMGIEPEYQGRGFGKKLIEKIEEIAKKRNIKTIEFMAVDEENEEMVYLLKKYGYCSTRGYNPEIFIKEL